jgi:hypothetical protein
MSSYDTNDKFTNSTFHESGEGMSGMDNTFSSEINSELSMGAMDSAGKTSDVAATNRQKLSQILMNQTEKKESNSRFSHFDSYFGSLPVGNTSSSTVPNNKNVINRSGSRPGQAAVVLPMSKNPVVSALTINAPQKKKDVPPPQPIKQQEAAVSESLSELSDNADLNDDSVEETENQIICTFESVKRTKNKWKFVLKNGVMHINNTKAPNAGFQDYLFAKAIGDGEW